MSKYDVARAYAIEMARPEVDSRESDEHVTREDIVRLTDLASCAG